MENTNQPRVVIIGAGFAGLSAATVLKNSDVAIDLTIIDARERFEYTPGLHLALTDEAEDEKISFPLKKYYNETYIQDTIVTVKENSVIGTSNIEYPYDYLILATGSRQNYFNNKSFKQYAHSVKSLSDVQKLRTELASAETIAVIGGGYTGIEIASILATESDKKVHLIHSRDRLMPQMHPMVGTQAAWSLQKAGVSLILNERLQLCSDNCVQLKSGKVLESDIIILSGGIIPNCDILGETVIIDKHLQVDQYKNVFVCGDAAPNDNLATAHGAMVEGRQAAHNVLQNILHGPEVVLQHSVSDKLGSLSAVALGPHHGILTWRTYGIFIPFIIGMLKKIIQIRSVFELKHKVALPL